MKFLQIEEGGPNFWGESILQKIRNIWSPLLYFNFKSFKYRISSSFIRFECILHDSAVFFWESSNFYKLKGGRGGDLISGGKQFSRKSESFGPAFCILILKDLWTQVFRHSLYFNAFCMIQEYFSQSFGISTNLGRATKFLGGTDFAESLNFGLPFCISILKVLSTNFLHHSLDFNAFYMVQD